MQWWLLGAIVVLALLSSVYLMSHPSVARGRVPKWFRFSLIFFVVFFGTYVVLFLLWLSLSFIA